MMPFLFLSSHTTLYLSLVAMMFLPNVDFNIENPRCFEGLVICVLPNALWNAVYPCRARILGQVDVCHGAGAADPQRLPYVSSFNLRTLLNLNHFPCARHSSSLGALNVDVSAGPPPSRKHLVIILLPQWC